MESRCHQGGADPELWSMDVKQDQPWGERRHQLGEWQQASTLDIILLDPFFLISFSLSGDKRNAWQRFHKWKQTSMLVHQEESKNGMGGTRKRSKELILRK